VKKTFPFKCMYVCACACVSLETFCESAYFLYFSFQKEFDRSTKSHFIFPNTRFPLHNVLAIHLAVIIIYPHFSTRNYYLFVNRILFWHSKQCQSDFFSFNISYIQRIILFSQKLCIVCWKWIYLYFLRYTFYLLNYKNKNIFYIF
jgi:hypothetical protein